MIALGIDLGGTSAKIGVVKDGNIIESVQVPTRPDSDYQGIVEDLTDAAKKLLIYHKAQKAGIGSPGIINTKTGVVCFSNNIRWNDAPLRDDIENALGLPAEIANDAKCAALGEAVYGAGKGFSRVAMLTLGTGVGGGFVVNGKLEKGSMYEDASSTFGHMTLVPNGRPCTCGRKGCLEAYCSATAVSQRAQQVLGISSVKEVFERAKNKETKAVWLVENFASYLAAAAVSLANILRPQRIVIGGGMSASAKMFLPQVQEALKREVYGSEYAPVKVVAAKLGNKAGIIGASLL